MRLAMVLLALVNAHRTYHDERALDPVPRIAACGEFHPLICVRRAGLRARKAGVISAWGVHSPSEAVGAWLRSPPHRAIMLDPSYEIAGALVNGTFARVVFAQTTDSTALRSDTPTRRVCASPGCSSASG